MESIQGPQCVVCYSEYNNSLHRPWDLGCHCICQRCYVNWPGPQLCPVCRKSWVQPHVAYDLMQAAEQVAALTQGNASGAGGAMRAGLARWPALLWVRELVGIPVMELALHVCVAYPSIRWVVSLLGPAAAVLAVQRCVVVLLPAVLVVAPVLSAAALYLELNAWNARDVAEVRQRLPATAPPPTITLPSGPLTAAAALCALPVLASLSQLAATGQLQWLMMGGTCALSAYCLYGWVQRIYIYMVSGARPGGLRGTLLEAGVVCGVATLTVLVINALSGTEATHPVPAFGGTLWTGSSGGGGGVDSLVEQGAEAAAAAAAVAGVPPPEGHLLQAGVQFFMGVWGAVMQLVWGVWAAFSGGHHHQSVLQGAHSISNDSSAVTAATQAAGSSVLAEGITTHTNASWAEDSSALLQASSDDSNTDMLGSLLRLVSAWLHLDELEWLLPLLKVELPTMCVYAMCAGLRRLGALRLRVGGAGAARPLMPMCTATGSSVGSVGEWVVFRVALMLGMWVWLGRGAALQALQAGHAGYAVIASMMLPCQLLGVSWQRSGVGLEDKVDAMTMTCAFLTRFSVVTWAAATPPLVRLLGSKPLGWLPMGALAKACALFWGCTAGWCTIRGVRSGWVGAVRTRWEFLTRSGCSQLQMERCLTEVKAMGAITYATIVPLLLLLVPDGKWRSLLCASVSLLALAVDVAAVALHTLAVTHPTMPLPGSAGGRWQLQHLAFALTMGGSSWRDQTHTGDQDVNPPMAGTATTVAAAAAGGAGGVQGQAGGSALLRSLGPGTGSGGTTRLELTQAEMRQLVASLERLTAAREELMSATRRAEAAANGLDLGSTGVGVGGGAGTGAGAGMVNLTRPWLSGGGQTGAVQGGTSGGGGGRGGDGGGGGGGAGSATPAPTHTPGGVSEAGGIAPDVRQAGAPVRASVVGGPASAQNDDDQEGFVNGVYVGSGFGWEPTGRYGIPRGMLREMRARGQTGAGLLTNFDQALPPPGRLGGVALGTGMGPTQARDAQTGMASQPASQPTTQSTAQEAGGPHWDDAPVPTLTQDDTTAPQRLPPSGASTRYVRVIGDDGGGAVRLLPVTSAAGGGAGAAGAGAAGAASASGVQAGLSALPQGSVSEAGGDGGVGGSMTAAPGQETLVRVVSHNRIRFTPVMALESGSMESSRAQAAGVRSSSEGLHPGGSAREVLARATTSDHRQPASPPNTTAPPSDAASAAAGTAGAPTPPGSIPVHTLAPAPAPPHAPRPALAVPTSPESTAPSRALHPAGGTQAAAGGAPTSRAPATSSGAGARASALWSEASPHPQGTSTGDGGDAPLGAALGSASTASTTHAGQGSVFGLGGGMARAALEQAAPLAVGHHVVSRGTVHAPRRLGLLLSDDDEPQEPALVQGAESGAQLGQGVGQGQGMGGGGPEAAVSSGGDGGGDGAHQAAGAAPAAVSGVHVVSRSGSGPGQRVGAQG